MPVITPLKPKTAAARPSVKGIPKGGAKAVAKAAAQTAVKAAAKTPAKAIKQPAAATAHASLTPEQQELLVVVPARLVDGALCRPRIHRGNGLAGRC